MTRRVVILQETLPHYRVELFAEVRRRAAARGIAVDVLHGFAPGERGRRLSTGALAKATTVENHYISAPGHNGVIIWQAALRRCLQSDLVVLEQANRMLINYVLLGLQRLRGPKVAFLGHGRNLQATRETSAERLKARMAAQPWWWFAYTAGVADHLIGLGVSRQRITVVGNTIDVIALGRDVLAARANESPRQPLRCVYLGGLYADKRLDILLLAADRIAERLPGFELHIAGSGELQGQIERFTASRSWATYLGPVEGETRVALLASARLLLNPGLVGLVVLDAFAAGVPLVTLADSRHSPEFEYLEAGVNGVVVGAGAGADKYADAVVRLLLDPEALDVLSSAAVKAAASHSIEEAAERFVDGLQAALECRRPSSS